MLVGKQVQLAVGCRGKRFTDEVADIERGIGDLPALAAHIVGQDDGLAVAQMRADHAGIGDPAVIEILAGLHLGLQLFEQIVPCDEIVLDLDPGQFSEGFGQRFQFVVVGGELRGNDIDFHFPEGLGRPFRTTAVP